jgi:predicted metal-binding protein
MQTKRCYQCKQEKALEEFAIKKTAKDGRAFECKTCHNEWCRNHYAKNRQYYIDRNKLTKLNNARKIQEFKRNSNGCVICKEKEPCCLDFHHLRDKKFTVSMMTTRSW